MYQQDGYALSVAHSSTDVRAEFITKTYTHLFGAIVAFTLLEIAAFTVNVGDMTIAEKTFQLIATSRVGWLGILGAFMVVGWLGSHLARSTSSAGAQYAGLGIYVVGEAIIFMPLLYIAERFCKGGVIESAAMITLIGFAALTAIAFVTRKDFSFLGPILMWVGVCAFLMIIGSVIFGITLGLVFSVLMVAFAGASILHSTSNIIHHYPPSSHVAAALELFAAVALMFWYVLRILIALNRD